jgi:small subunit ribosomal protein S17
VADENVNEETEAAAEPEPETTDAPEGVADVENLPEETPDPEQGEPEASAEPPAAEPESTEEPAEGGPADDSGEPEASAETAPEPTEEPAEGAPADEPVAEAEPAPAQAEPRKKKKRLPRALRPARTKTRRERSAERRPIVRLPKPEGVRGRTQERQGVVVSSGADKTIVVRVDVVKAHPMYKKVIKRSTKLHAHDERNEAKVGDIVRIVETRPLSRMKRWRLQEIVEAAK